MAEGGSLLGVPLSFSHLTISAHAEHADVSRLLSMLSLLYCCRAPRSTSPPSKFPYKDEASKVSCALPRPPARPPHPPAGIASRGVGQQAPGGGRGLARRYAHSFEPARYALF